ncbi:hypothetical protein, partial [Burkholderia gladioli]|uniref:hypothetical protein n=1 Tax=Burkholderia gladioli TaxID=28095 RepID=UPI001E5954AE
AVAGMAAADGAATVGAAEAAVATAVGAATATEAGVRNLQPDVSVNRPALPADLVSGGACSTGDHRPANETAPAPETRSGRCVFPTTE